MAWTTYYGKDPRFLAEQRLLALTEKIVEINGQPKGIEGIAFWILERIAGWLIWRHAK
jgi:hypothetical protein